MSDFACTVRQKLAARAASAEVRLCPDQYVGTLAGLKTNDQFQRDSAANRAPGVKCVLLILESPHTSEFRGALGPAAGSTGSNIRRYLRQVLGKLWRAEFGLMLVNAVQYQCSLGVHTSVFRDEMFRAAWDGWAKGDFEKRIKRYYRDDDLVLNACTDGKPSKLPKLQHLVRIAIQDSLPKKCQSFEANHPSSWHNDGYRVIFTAPRPAFPVVEIGV